MGFYLDGMRYHVKGTRTIKESLLLSFLVLKGGTLFYNKELDPDLSGYFKRSFFCFMGMNIFLACMQVYRLHALLMEVRGGHQISRDWSSRL